MNYTLHPLKGMIQGTTEGTIVGLIKGDTRSFIGIRANSSTNKVSLLRGAYLHGSGSMRQEEDITSHQSMILRKLPGKGCALLQVMHKHRSTVLAACNPCHAEFNWSLFRRMSPVNFCFTSDLLSTTPACTLERLGLATS